MTPPTIIARVVAHERVMTIATAPISARRKIASPPRTRLDEAASCDARLGPEGEVEAGDGPAGDEDRKRGDELSSDRPFNRYPRHPPHPAPPHAGLGHHGDRCERRDEAEQRDPIDKVKRIGCVLHEHG
jgi:hypothetical protein